MFIQLESVLLLILYKYIDEYVNWNKSQSHREHKKETETSETSMMTIMIMIMIFLCLFVFRFDFILGQKTATTIFFSLLGWFTSCCFFRFCCFCNYCFFFFLFCQPFILELTCLFSLLVFCPFLSFTLFALAISKRHSNLSDVSVFLIVAEFSEKIERRSD